MHETCHYCPAPATEIEHIVPRALGGTDRKANLTTSCTSCNRAKGANWPTCRCRICRVAIDLFKSDPKRLAIAVAELENRRRQRIASAITAEANAARHRALAADLDELLREVQS